MSNDLMAFFKIQQKKCPIGVSLKLQGNKYLLLQFVDPSTGTRKPKPCNVKFTEEGIVLAVAKAHKVAEALNTFKTSSEFWSWYDHEILGVNQIENDLVTYRDIFSQIETEYFNGYHRGNGKKRSKDNPSDVASFTRCYGEVFKRFTNLDSYPSWEVIKSVLFSWEQGTKQFKDTYSVLKKVCELSANSKELLAKIEKIDSKQHIFKELQSISLKDFLSWYDDCNSQIEGIKSDKNRKARKSWLWVSAMCVLYGLRPSEVAAAKNLTESVTIDKINIPALNDPDNQDLLLILGDYTYFGTSIKTGGRICVPMTTDKKLIERLNIQSPSLPIVNPSDSCKAKSKVERFDNSFYNWLSGNQSPVTQTYAFRHLANQLGELYGIPQEIRARSLGHSVAINDSVYKSRNNVQTTIDLLTNHSKLPISLNLAKEKLTTMGVDINDPMVMMILKVIYQLDDII